MPSRDLQKTLRTPSFRAKLSSMKGLSPDEKALFQRIGNLVDVLSYAQRQVSNPGRGRARVPDPRVPKPENLSVTGVTRGVLAQWDEVDFKVPGDGLEFYEVEFSESITFSELLASFEVVGTRITFKSNPTGGNIFVRVRAVSKKGKVSDYNTSSATSTVDELFLVDQDAIDPENRTAVLPHPELLGTALENNGGNILTGFGAYVGPSPFTLDDQHSGFSANIDIRHDITFALHERAAPFPGIENLRLDTIGSEHIEDDSFYTFVPSFYIRPVILPGSLTDFFTVAAIATDPLQIDIEFLWFSIINSFYFPYHPLAGYVFNAAMSTFKFYAKL